MAVEVELDAVMMKNEMEIGAGEEVADVANLKYYSELLVVMVG